MSNKRTNVSKIFKCSVCAKADYKQIMPGAVSFFNRCSFTPDCAGLLSLDPNAEISPRSTLTWRQTPTVYKIHFAKIRTLVITHSFGHVGALVVEVFVEANTATGITHVKTTEFKVLSQTANSVTIDLLTSQTGVAVVTDNQYSSPALYTAPATWAAPTLLTANVVTIAADIDVPSFTATLLYKSMTSVDSVTQSLTFINHYQPSGQLTPIGSTLWTHYKVLALEKPYFLYSVALADTSILQKGTSIQLTGATLPTIIWPMATSQKTAATDIVQNRIIRNSVIRLGDLIVDNSQLVVANSSIIEELRKPFVIY